MKPNLITWFHLKITQARQTIPFFMAEASRGLFKILSLIRERLSYCQTKILNNKK